MKNITLILILFPIVILSQKIRESEYVSYESQNKQWVRCGYVESLFNKQTFSFDKKGNILEKKNYDKNDKLIGIAKFTYKNELLIKRVYNKNPKLKKKLWETFYKYDIKGNKISEVWYLNKIELQDSTVFNYSKNKLTEIKYDDKKSVLHYWIYELKNGNKTIEYQFHKDSSLTKEIIWNRTEKGVPISKKLNNRTDNSFFIYTYNEKGVVINITKNDKQYQRFEITEDEYGNWKNILTYNENNELINKVVRKIKYY